MKQHITIDQLNELSEKGKEKLRKWWKPEKGDMVYHSTVEVVDFIVDGRQEGTTWERLSYKDIDDNDYPLLSIGQMIEFLDENIDSSRTALAIDKGEHEWHVYGISTSPTGWKSSRRSVELCDALWGAVKEVLNET